MDMDQLQKNLEEALEHIDFLTIEKDTLKRKYDDAKNLIEKLKTKLEDLRSEKESEVLIEDCDNNLEKKK